jgi:tRNA-specific 2-thiouridylase
LPDFLQQQLKPKKGVIVEIPKEEALFKKNKVFSKQNKSIEALKSLSNNYIYTLESGQKVGKHNGAHYFTIGQRKGINIGGKEEPLFVIHTDTKSNTIYVGQGTNHPGLYRPGLKVPNEDIHWVREDMRLQVGESINVKSRIRYRQPLEKAILNQRKDGLYIIFENDQRGIAPGQFVAWYTNDELLGSGVIS